MMSARQRLWFVALAICCGMLALQGCSGGSGNSNSGNGGAPAIAAGTLSSGTRALAGANVVLLAAGDAGYGEGAAVLGQATTGTAGQWTIDFDCPPSDPQVYVRSDGGLSGATMFMSLLGRCSELPAQTPIDELDTIAAVYAVSQFLDESAQQIGAPASNAKGLDNAVELGRRLLSIARSTPTADDQAVVPVAKIDTLANLIDACIESSGTNSSSCQSLFSAATLANGSASTSVLQAVLAIARNPGGNLGTLFDLAPANGPFQPALDDAPTDWLISMILTGGGLNAPEGVAIDGEGNAWIANYNDAVSEFAADGSPLSSASGFTAGGLHESFGIAVDQTGNVWVTNQESAAGVNSQFGSITKLDPNGSPLSGASGYTTGGVYFPQSVAIDADGNAWIVNYGNSSVSKLAANGSALSPDEGFSGGGLNYPVALAIDVAGVAWISNQGNDSVTALSATGVAISPTRGYTGGGLSIPAEICTDADNNVWIANFHAQSAYSVTELAGSGSATPGAARSPDGGYTGGGLNTPNGCAIDGNGNVWITNYNGASLSKLAGSRSTHPGTAISPDSGYAKNLLSQPFGVAIDASGNVWVSNSANNSNSLTLLLGAAKPVKTPLIGPPTLP